MIIYCGTLKSCMFVVLCIVLVYYRNGCCTWDWGYYKKKSNKLLLIKNFIGEHLSENKKKIKFLYITFFQIIDNFRFFEKLQMYFYTNFRYGIELIFLNAYFQFFFFFFSTVLTLYTLTFQQNTAQHFNFILCIILLVK